MKLFLCASAAALMAASAAQAGGPSPNLLVNGSFESPGLVDTGRDTIGQNPLNQDAEIGGAPIQGWSFNGMGFAIYEDNGQDGINAADGNWYISMGHDGSVGESFTQHVGPGCSAGCVLTYDVTEQQGTDPLQEVDVTVIGDYGTDITVHNTDIGTNWKTGVPISFTELGDVYVTFTDVYSAPGANVGVDNFCLNATGVCPASGLGVPEPTGWLLMILGAGLAGGALRRGREGLAKG